MPDERKDFADSAELRRYVAGMTGRVCLLGFSGKDSVAAWLALRPHFDHIVPYNLYAVPGLRIVEDALRYYEDYFATPILRLPHPSLYRMLRNFTFQPPERCAAIEAANLPRLDYEDIYTHVRKVAGAPDAWVAIGTRSADSPTRLLNIRQNGALSYRKRQFFPVYDWRIADVAGAIQAAGVYLSDEYRLFGRSFDGIDYRFLRPLRDHYPDDYQRVLDWFPLADLELFRRDHGQPV